MRKRIIAFMMVFVLILPLVACGNTETGEKIKSQTDSESKKEEKIQIVFEYQDGHVNEEFESTLETMFDVDIIMDMNKATSPYMRLEQELTHNMAPDMVLCEYIRRIEDDVQAQYFYDLGSESFVNDYYLSAIEACTAADGGLYYIPGPSYVYGIVYDKTAFSELGLSVPTNYSEFVELIKKVDAMELTGIEPDPDDETKTVEVPVKAFVPTMRWSDMFQIIFNTMNYEDSIRGITNAKWLNDYQKGTGSMVGHMEGAAEKYIKLFDDGIMSLDYWNVGPGYRSKKLYDYHTSLMTIECQQGYEFNKEWNKDKPENMHEMGMMPIYTSDEPDSGYLYSIPRSFISITNQGAEDAKKLDVMLKIMDYLSTPDGQKLLINGSDYFGFLKDDMSLDSDFYADVMDTIEEERIISSFYYEDDNNGGVVENYMHSTTSDLINGSISVKEWLEGADIERENALKQQESQVYGTVQETMVPLQTAYIDGLAYLNSMDADIAYVPVDACYGTESYFYSGDITDDMINLISTEKFYNINPDEDDMQFVIVEMTGRELLDTALSLSDYGMAAFAGVEMIYSMSGENGEQYVSLKINGEDMDMDKSYRIATLRGAVSGFEVLETYEELNFVDMFKCYLETQNGMITVPQQLEIVE
ncbi:MAG: 5'-nucleotidase C-terminal domain-containing protein [Lachnospiraceae bacterium]